MAKINPDKITDINSLTLPTESVADSVVPEEIKRGARNVLWLTVREGRTFILKGLIEPLRSRPDEVVRLRKEYSLGLRINHPGVAGVYGFEVNAVLGPVVVMEYIDGITLNQFLSEGKPKPIDVRLKIARQIADTLNHIHRLGISHRDLKPNNILITQRNDAKIIDWGSGDSEDAVIYKMSLGTIEFGAPEQQRPFPADSRADVYSFGKILEHLLPESCFSKLREGCRKLQLQQRPTIQEVSERLAVVFNNNERAESKSGVIFALALFILGVGGLFLMYLTRTSESPRDLQKKIVESANSATSIVNRESDETPATAETTIGESEKGTALTNYNVGKTDKNAPSEVEQVNENARVSADYEAIFNKHLEKMLSVINEIGPGFIKEKGYYDYDVLSARTRQIPSVVNAAMAELSAAGCPYDELSRFAIRINEEAKKAYDRVDGVNQ